LLSLFVDGPHWIAWTPEGYYAAAPDSERLMGWHVNNGSHSLAAFHPASRFRASLYRPDVIARLLEAGSVPAALEAADRARGTSPGKLLRVDEVLPPKVSLAAPKFKDLKLTTPTLEVEATAQPTGGHPILSLQLLLDGRPYPGGGGLRRLADAGPAVTVKVGWTVEVPPGEHKLSVLARSAVSTAVSNDLDVLLNWPLPRPKMFVLAVGINAYKDRNFRLSCSVNDASEVAKTLGERSQPLYDVQTRLLTNDRATRLGIVNGLQWLKENVRPADVVVVFFSGHGEQDGGHFYLLPHDVEVRNLGTTAISGEELQRRLGDLPGPVLLLLDACHSGGIGRGAENITRALADDDCGVVVLCAALGSEKAGEIDGHGFFSRALVEGLEGKGPRNRRDGCVYLHHLEQYVIDRVGELSQDRQHPTSARPAYIRTFPIARP
jgi:hypothetical protein